jgi:hypothetical protein
MKKRIKARTAKHPQEEMISIPLSLGKKLLKLHENYKGMTRQRDRRQAGEDPDVTGAADLLGRVYHKLTCFAALFGGDQEVIALIDHAGAWIILTEILDEIEKAENLLSPAQAAEEGS